SRMPVLSWNAPRLACCAPPGDWKIGWDWLSKFHRKPLLALQKGVPRSLPVVFAEFGPEMLKWSFLMPLKTLFLNPPSFENFDGGAGSRWPATREIESYGYPVWLAYPAGRLEGARLLDAPPHYVSAEQTIQIARDYEFLVLYTSTPGFPGDIRLAQKIKD